MWKYRQSLKDNPKSGYDWSATGQWQTAFCVCVNENTENVEDLVVSQEDNPKTYQLNREISCETGIHWLTVHRLIYRDLQLNCVKWHHAQQLSETNHVARLTRYKYSCCKRYSLTSYGLGMKHFTVETPFNSQNDRVYAPIDNKKQYIDPSRLLHMSVMVSVAVSQVGMTEVKLVSHGVKVNSQYYCDVLLSQQMLPAIKHVAERCLFTKQYVACGEICHFFVLCDFPR